MASSGEGGGARAPQAPLGSSTVLNENLNENLKTLKIK